jgi:hypothetical protein
MPQPAAPGPGLSVFFPACNDSTSIASLVMFARRTPRLLTDDVEVIIVNDGSADATAARTQRAATAGSHGPTAES